MVKKVPMFLLEMDYVSMKRRTIPTQERDLKLFNKLESRSMILESIEFIEEFEKHRLNGLEMEWRLDSLSEPVQKNDHYGTPIFIIIIIIIWF